MTLGGNGACLSGPLYAYMVKHYKLDHLDLSTPDGIIWSNDEMAGKKLAAGLMALSPAHWRLDFSYDSIDMRFHHGATLSSILKHEFGIERENVTEPTYVTKDGKEYCVSDQWYYLRTATQDQVDISNALYGYHRARLFHRPYNWKRCLVLWKDDFFRIAHPEEMDKDMMLILYLGIFATGFQDDGVGMIDGYQIADYKTFAQVATKEQLDAVNADIKRRKRSISVLTRMSWSGVIGSVKRLFSRLYWSIKIEDIKSSLDDWFASKGINIRLLDDRYYDA